MPRVESAKRRRRFAVSIALGAASTAVFFGCVDLFHSTDFGVTCDPDAGPCAASSDDAGPDAAHRDARTDARPDARADAPRGADARHDGAQTPDGGDASVDATTAPDGKVDAGTDAAKPPKDAGVDGTVDFCNLDGGTAQEYARNACLWLGSCEGTTDFPQNQFDTCYRNALPAFDCQANPNLRVLGRVHDFWNALSKVTSCEAGVAKALFPAGAPTCTGESLGCGGPNDELVVTCAGAGAAPLAQNCAAAGLACVSDVCSLVHPVSCPASPSCENGKILHRCVDGVDVGQDCTNFGAGACIQTDAGTAGCAPSANPPACAPAAATCAGANVVDCTSGARVTVDCPKLGPFACLNGLCMGDPNAGTVDVCNNSGQIQTDLGVDGGFVVSCTAVGLVPCVPESAGLDVACGSPE